MTGFDFVCWPPGWYRGAGPGARPAQGSAVRGGVLLAFVAAIWWEPTVYTWLEPYIETTAAAQWECSYAVVFIIVLLGVGLVNMTLSALIRSTGLSPADHGLGGMFGLARGLLIVLALVAAAGYTPLPQEPWWQNAMFSHSAIEAIKHIKTWLPPSLATWLPGHRRGPVNQLLYDSLLLLQHRGQDAAGMRNVQRQPVQYVQGAWPGARRVPHPQHARAARHVRRRPGTLSHRGFQRQRGRGPALLRECAVWHHVRPQRQPDELARVARIALPRRPPPYQHQFRLRSAAQRAGPRAAVGRQPACRWTMTPCSAPYRRISGYGLLAFRDPHGYPSAVYRAGNRRGRRVMVGVRIGRAGRQRFCASVRDVRRATRSSSTWTAVFAPPVADNPQLVPCIFEYVYFARPDSMIDGVSVYGARLRMGEYLADKVARNMRLGDIDVVMPIPDSSRPAAMQLAARLGLDYREGLIKNRSWAAPSSCRAKPCAVSRCVRSSIAIGWSSRAERVLGDGLHRARNDQPRDRRTCPRRWRQSVYFASAALRCVSPMSSIRHADARGTDRAPAAATDEIAARSAPMR
ncbi:hypothetical protein FQR65_LT18343 [Abscondita terminalis]|nr:hypothetical protein FQR65_LT18343 [Abscondita terminalis]